MVRSLNQVDMVMTVMTEQPVATITESDDAMSRSQTVFMVAALVLSVISFMLNATMLAPAIRDINSHLGPCRAPPTSPSA